MVGMSAVAELIICTINTPKAAYIRCHRWNIGILISDPKSTQKIGPGDVQYVIFQCGFIIIIVFAPARTADMISMRVISGEFRQTIHL